MKYLTSFFILISIICVPSFAQTYEVERVSVVPFEKSLIRTGRIDFKRTLKLSFKSSGYLSKLSVDEGDFFQNKAILATLDTSELNAEKNSRYVQLLQAKREVNRIKKLLEQELSSQQALDVAQTQVETTREAYRIAYYNLEKAQVLAPFDGIVLKRFTELAEFQSPGKEIIEIARINNNLIVKVALTTDEISYVQLGQSVNVQLVGLGNISGEISKIPALANTDGQLYLIEVLISDAVAGQGIFAGQLAQVTIDFSTENLVYQVPISALVEIDSVGDAILMTKGDGEQLMKQAFSVLNIDSHYLYLRAKGDQQSLEIITSGWQQFLLNEL